MAISGEGILHNRETTFEIITNLETIFAGAFLQDDDDDAVDEGNYFTSSVRTDKSAKTICFRKEVLALPIIKSVIGCGRGRPKGSLNKPKNGIVGVLKKPKIFSTWLECKQCQYKCRKRKPLQTHMLEEHNEIIYLCEHCEKIFKDKTEMQEHERGVHGGIKYPCPELDCSYSTPDIQSLEEHIESTHQDLSHKHEISHCKRCDFTTSNPKLLKCHEDTFHKTVEYNCSQCDFKCNWESSLRQHTEQCHGSKDFSCDVCSFTCRWKTALNKHKRDKHSETGSVTQCSFCGVEFPCRRDLKRHIRENHEIPQEFKCSYCGKNFPKKPNLKIHERIHTGEKPYKCETCGHAFTAASNLYHHKKKHANESCAAKVAIKQESKGGAVQGIYEQGYLPQQNYRAEDLHNSVDNVSSHNLSQLDSPGEAHHDPRLDLMETKSESQSYHDPSYLSNFSQYYSGYPQSPAQTNKMQNAMFDQYIDSSPDQYR